MTSPDQTAADREALLELLLADEGIELASPSIGRRAEGQPAVLSYPQERMWFLDEFEDDTAALGNYASVAMHGRLDVAALTRGLDEIVRRHEVLRTVIVAEAGQARPVVLQIDTMPLTTVDVDGDEDALADVLAAAAVRTFDLAAEPPIMVTLVRVDDRHHVLAVMVHHIASDGSSLGIFFRELAALYTAFLDGRPSPLPPLAVQYEDYASWQRTEAAEVFERQLAYWREQLAGPLPSFEIAPDFTRPARHTFSGATVSARLPAETVKQLEALCKHASATMFMGLLAGFEVVTARHAGETDVVIGTPVAGRVRIELEPMIGVFLNTLALRNDLRDRPTFRKLLDRVRDTNLDAYANQDIPFDLVLADLQVPRDLSRTPVFQVFFNMTHLDGGEERFTIPGLRVEMLEPPVFGAKFDLTMYVNESVDGIDLRLVYNSRLYDRAHMGQLLDQYVHLLGQVAADPDQPIDAYTLVHERDAAALPDAAAPLDHAWHGSVPARISAVARRAPGRVAVVDRVHRWTYDTLARQMSRLGSWLNMRRVGRGDVVAIYGHRTGSLVWSVSGVLAAGAVYLLLDSRYPPSRLAQLLRIAKPKAWIALDAAGAVPVEVLDALDDLGVEHRLQLPEVADVGALEALLGTTAPAGAVPGDVGWIDDDIGPDDAACLTFTSGSTGIPKAVVGRHGSLTHFLPWMSEAFGVGEGDRFSMLSGLSHDPLQRDMFWPLSIGATIAVPDPELMGSPGYLAQWLRDEKVTIAHLTPAMGQLVAEGVGEGSCREVTIDSLHVALFIGDVLTREQTSRLWTLAPNVRIVNLYGTTETQRASGYHIVDRAEPAPEGVRLKEVLPLGRGMPGCQLLVRTPTGAPAGIGEVGEIVMRSPHLALGYWGDDELTAARFQHDRHGVDDRDQLYATGDRGRYRPDGLVEFLGRTDGQVQLRGFRIELGEVAAALRRQEGVADAVVDLRCDPVAGHRLVGYVVPAGRTSLDETLLLSALRTELPAHMVPSEIVELARVPLTPNGKLDRRALPAPTRADGWSQGVTAPRDALEEALVEIWADVLGRPEVGVHDDFFALGGYSLMATRVLARIEDRTGARLPIALLFEHPTIAGLATAIRSRAGGAAPRTAIVPVSRDVPVPASPAQQRLLFMDRFAGRLTVHNLPIVLRVEGELDAVALRWSVEQLLRRHEALRTDFLATAAGWDQVVVDADDAVLEWQDDAIAGWDQAVDRVRDEVRRPFDLAAGPKVRALLVRLGDGDQLFALTMHHIAVDGWSIRRLLGELVELYRSRVDERPAVLPDLPVQYLDYAAWLQDELVADAVTEGVAYWTAHLAGPMPVLDLPADLPRPAVQTYRGGTLYVEVPADLYEQVRAAARTAGVTPFTFLLASYVAVLARWSGQDDFVVGTATANRVRPELDAVVGLFMNTLALRARVDVERPFTDLLEATKQTMLGAFEHESIPFDRVVEAINPTRDVSRSIVFQTTFVLNNLPLPERLELAGVHAEPVAVSAGATEQDVAVSVVELADRAVVRVEYNADVFAAPTVERLMEHWCRLLASAAADPARAVGALELLPEGEQALIERWSQGRDVPVPTALRLDQLVARRAAERPAAVAVVADGESVTYAQLMERSHRIARALVDAGVGNGERVGVAVDRSVAMVATVLGVLEAGAAYVPLDPDFPPDRLAFMVEDAGVRVVVTSAGSLSGRLDTSGLTVLDVVDDAAAIGAWDAAPLPGDGADPPGIAYVIYTSGSTGVPKGVEVAHANAVNLLQSMVHEPGLTADDVLLAVTTLSFDISVLEIFGPLVAGGRLVVAGRDDASDGRRLAELIASSSATVVQATPTTWSMLFDSGWSGDRGLTILCGGEAMPTDLGRRLHDACGPVWNMFGPTETTIWSTVQPVDAAALEHSTVPIGRPIANTVCRVLDADRRLVPIGVPGELYIGGAGVARGYLHREQLTAERFVSDPFAADPAARLYRSGDLVRWRPDGSIEFLGRVDFQVKVRGHRIELGEIEAALRAHPSVTDVVVVADGQAGDGRLIAYPMFAGPAEPSVADLRAWLRERLPDYMVPSRFVPVDAFPLTPNRKIDRTALPKPRDAASTGEPFVEPRTDIERVVAQIVAETVGVERVGVDDDFFELGGHSLHATSVLAKIESAFSRRLELRSFFLSPTVASLAAALEAGGGRAAAPIVRVDRAVPVPASSQQERLLFVDQFSGSSVFNLPIAEHLSGDLDEAALRSAVAEVLRRHESLRTTFEFVGDGWNQVVRAPDEVELPWIAGVVDRWDDAVARVRAEAARAFDARTDVKIRGMLLRVGSQNWAFVVIMHHIAVDGWSIRRIITEIAELYRAQVEHRSAVLPDLPVQYLDYTVWQRGRIVSGEYAEGLAYWVEHLRAPLPVLDLPTDHPRPAIQTFAAGTVTTSLPPGLLAAVRKAARAHGVTPFVFLLSGYVATLARWSGQDDVVVGTAAANRANADLHDVVGMFVNTLALRTPVDVDRPFTALLETTKQAVLGAFEHQSVPFDRVVEAVNPPRDLRRSVVFQTMFVLNTLPERSDMGIPGIHSEPIEVSTGSTEHDLAVMVAEHHDGADVRMAFNTDVFEAATVERLMGHWQLLLASAAADATRPVGSLSMMPEDERAVLLDFAVPSPQPQLLPGVRRLDELVALRVLATPDLIAVEHRDRGITYRDLDARANRCARRLIAAGVVPGDRVGVAVERSVGMVAAVLAVLKVGAAYVPLDPSLPSERLSFMIADSGASAVLVSPGSLRVDVDVAAAALIDVAPDADDVDDGDAGPVTVDTADHPGGGAAWVIYTSGSTGRPKGVEVEHASALNFALAMLDAPGIQPDDVLLAVPTLSFDPSVMDLFLPPLVGAKVVIADRDDVVDARRLAHLIDTSGATVMQATPTTWSMLLDSGWGGSPRMKALCGGEAMPVDLARRLRRVCRSVWNMYGPTETTVWSAVHEVTESSLHGVNVPVGRPIGGLVYRIVDADDRLLPIGVPGELIIGGAGVARGYVNRPELTAERFGPDPFDPSGRVYRTGDLARWGPDGNVEFLGRLDFQVKLRGNRIELGEIEAALRGQPDIADAVVVAHGAGMEQQLDAYLVPTSSVAVVQAADLRSALRRKLPDYMVPATFTWLDAFPLTASRKIDRNALPAPQVAPVVRRADAGPSDALERMLVDVWQTVLGRKHVSVHDDFFALGGYSLLATRLFAMVEARTGKRLPVSVLFEHPTIAELAEAIRNEGWRTEWSSLVAIQPAGTQQPFFYVTPYLISVLELAPLGDELGRDRPLYGLQPQGLDGTLPPHTSIQEMAAHYIMEMKTVQPEGPYAVGGHCAGSWVAFEVAKQLTEAGEEVNSLVLVDQGPPGVERPKVKPLRYIMTRVRFYLSGGRLRYAVAFRLKVSMARFLLRRVGPPTARFEASVREVHRQAHRGYVGGRVDQDIMVILSEDSLALEDRAWYTRWNELTDGQVTTRHVGGTHANLLVQPFVGQLATVVSDALAVEQESTEGEPGDRGRAPMDEAPRL